jgi:hypothetical protein
VHGEQYCGSQCRLGAIVVEQMECLKSWVREVVKSGSFVSAEMAVDVLNIEGGVGITGSNNIGNGQALDEED